MGRGCWGQGYGYLDLYTRHTRTPLIPFSIDSRTTTKNPRFLHSSLIIFLAYCQFKTGIKNEEYGLNLSHSTLNLIV
jgi:hypothetical protein